LGVGVKGKGKETEVARSLERNCPARPVAAKPAPKSKYARGKIRSPHDN